MLELVLIFSLTLFCLYLVAVPLLSTGPVSEARGAVRATLTTREAGGGEARGAEDAAAEEGVESLLGDLSDLEYDFRMDKMAEAEYRRRRRRLMVEANRLLAAQQDAAARQRARERVMRELGISWEQERS